MKAIPKSITTNALHLIMQSDTARKEEKMGYKIKEMREKRGISQEELSRLSNVSRVTISQLENDESKNASVKTLLKIAKALDAPLDAIFYT